MEKAFQVSTALIFFPHLDAVGCSVFSFSCKAGKQSSFAYLFISLCEVLCEWVCGHFTTAGFRWRDSLKPGAKHLTCFLATSHWVVLSPLTSDRGGVLFSCGHMKTKVSISLLDWSKSWSVIFTEKQREWGEGIALICASNKTTWRLCSVL